MKSFHYGGNHIFTNKGAGDVIYMNAGANETLSFSGLVNFESVSFSGVAQAGTQKLGNRFSSTTIGDISADVPDEGEVLVFNSTAGNWQPATIDATLAANSYNSVINEVPISGYEEKMWGLLVGFSSGVSGATRAAISEIKFSCGIDGTAQFSSSDLLYVAGCIPSGESIDQPTDGYTLSNSSNVYWESTDSTLGKTLTVFKSSTGFFPNPKYINVGAYNSSRSAFSSSLAVRFTSTWNPTGLQVSYIYGNYRIKNTHTFKQNVQFTTGQESLMNFGFQDGYEAYKFLGDIQYLTANNLVYSNASLNELSLLKPSRYFYCCALGITDTATASNDYPVYKRGWFGTQTVRFSGLNFYDPYGVAFSSTTLGTVVTYSSTGSSDSISGTVNVTTPTINLFDSSNSTYFAVGDVQNQWVKVDFSSTRLVFVGSVECRIATFSSTTYTPIYRVGIDNSSSETITATGTHTNSKRQDAIGHYIQRSGKYRITQNYQEQSRHFGVTFTSTTTSTGYTDSIIDICYSTVLAMFVAVGVRDITLGFVWTSTDGYTWTDRTSGTGITTPVTGCAWSTASSSFLIVTAGTTAYKSTTGTAWTAVTVPALSSYPRVKYSTYLSKFIITHDTTYYVTTANTITFSSSDITATGLASRSGWFDSDTSSTKLVLASGSATYGLIYSTDSGVTFTSSTGIGSRKFSSVAYSPLADVWVAAVNGSNSEIYTSDNGIAWTSQTVAISNQAPSFLALRFATVKYESALGIFLHKAADSPLLASGDGYNWRHYDTPFTNPAGILELSYAFLGHAFGANTLVLGAHSNETAYATSVATTASTTFQPAVVTRMGQIYTVGDSTTLGTEVLKYLDLQVGDFVTTVFKTTEDEALSISETQNYFKIDYLGDSTSNTTYQGIAPLTTAISRYGDLQCVNFSAYGEAYIEGDINGNLNCTDTTASTSTTTGAMVLAGGLGVAGAVQSGGVVTTTLTTDSTTTATGSIITAGGLGVAKAIFASTINIKSSTASTTPLTGAAIITGGLGVGGAIFCSSAFRTKATTASTTTTTGAIISDGGIGLAGQLTAGGALKTTDTTQATSTGSGSIIAAGGLGILKNFYMGGNLLSLNGQAFDAMARTTLNTASAVTTNTLTIVGTWNTAYTYVGTNALGNLPTCTDGITFSCTTAGYYTISACITFTANVDNYIDLIILCKNSGGTTQGRIRSSAFARDTISCSGQMYLSATDSFYISVIHQAGSNRTPTTSAGYHPWVSFMLHPKYA